MMPVPGGESVSLRDSDSNSGFKLAESGLQTREGDRLSG
jgi:hypothetical protein